MDSGVIVAVIAGGATIVAAIIGSIYAIASNKRKVRAEASKLEAEEVGVEFENMLKYNKIFQELTEPLKQQIEELRKEIDSMKPFLCYKIECLNRLKKNETSN
jgi:predicted RNase H-like nuclease (RuvC/YqgF family)